MKNKVTTLLMMLVALFTFPAVYAAQMPLPVKFYTGGPPFISMLLIVLGFIIELVIMHHVLRTSVAKTFLVTVVMNIVSVFIGSVLAMFVWPLVNLAHLSDALRFWIYLIVSVISSVVMESFTVLRFFPQIDMRKLASWLVVANILSILAGFVAIWITQ